jgi:hypothetical protein
LRVERIRRLKPGTGESQIQVDRIRIRELKVDPIKYVLFITLGMHNGKLGRIEEPAAVQPIRRDKVSPLLASVTKIKAQVGRPKLPYEAVTAPCGVVIP